MSSVQTVEETIQRLKLELARNGIAVIRKLKESFAEYDVKNTGVLAKEEFVSALMVCGFFLSKHESSALIRRYKATELDVTFANFLVDISVPLNDARLDAVKQLYVFLQEKGNTTGNIKFNDLLNTFDSSRHPAVKLGQQSPGKLEDMLKEALDGIEDDNGEISWETFSEYFNDISSSYPYNASRFVDMIESCWSQLFSESQKKKERTFHLKAKAEYFAAMTTTLMEKVQQKVSSTSTDKQTLLKAFKHFDYDLSGTVTFAEFSKTLEMFGVLMPTSDAEEFFNQLDGNKDGKLSYKEFVVSFFSES